MWRCNMRTCGELIFKNIEIDTVADDVTMMLMMMMVMKMKSSSAVWCAKNSDE